MVAGEDVLVDPEQVGGVVFALELDQAGEFLVAIGRPDARLALVAAEEMERGIV